MTLRNQQAKVALGSAAPGVDWATKYEDVCRLIRACPQFTLEVEYSGDDPEDVLQDVLQGILRREAGTSGWDPSRAKLGRYVWLVTWSICSNRRRARGSRLQARVGVLDGDEVVDAAVHAARRLEALNPHG